MKQPFLTLENTLYLACFGLALGLRVWALGAYPLNDIEGREALATLGVVRGTLDLMPNSAAYAAFTYLAFLLFDPANATARIIPALFGAAVVFAPALFKEVMGRWTALLASALLALSAGFIAASRSVDGAMLGITLLAIGLGCIWRSVRVQTAEDELTELNESGFTVTKPYWLYGGAVALGMGFASGHAFFTGALIVAVAMLVTAPGRAWARVVWRAIWPVRFTVVLVMTVTAVSVATVLLIYPTGLGVMGTSVAQWVGGFSPLTTDGRSWLGLLTFWFVYEPLAVGFGLFGLARAYLKNSPTGKALSLLLIVALAFTLLYSGRTMFDGLWVLLALTLLGAWAIVDSVRANWNREEWPQALVLGGILTALTAFALVNLAAFAEQVRTNPSLNTTALTLLNGQTINMSPLAYVWLSGLALIAGVLVAVLFGFGWSARAARVGATLTAALFGLIFGLGAGWGLNQRQAEMPLELWWPQPMAVEVNRLMDTLATTSNFAVGDETDVEVTVQAASDGALAWALRDYRHARFVTQLSVGVSSPVVIAPMQAGETQEQDPALGSAYVGQSFTIDYTWFPENLITSEQFGWLAFRRVPTTIRHANKVILWVRQDVARLQTASGVVAPLPQPAPDEPPVPVR